jgi:transcriptional regulator with XRE-family HTH domain
MTGSTIDSPLGGRVRARRQRRGWTLRDLADNTGLSVPYLSDIERGNVVNPTLETLTTLAAALEASVAELLGDQPAAPAERPLSVSLQRFVRSEDFTRRIERLAGVADRPAEHIRQEVIDFLATAPKRASGELTTEDWRRLLTYYASLLEEG